MGFILFGLVHEDEELRLFTLQQLAAVSKCPDVLALLLASPIFIASLSRVLDSSTVVAECAIKLLLDWLLAHESALQRFLQDDAVGALWTYSNPDLVMESDGGSTADQGNDENGDGLSSEDGDYDDDEDDDEEHGDDEDDVKDGDDEVDRQKWVGGANAFTAPNPFVHVNAVGSERAMHILDLIVKLYASDARVALDIKSRSADGSAHHFALLLRPLQWLRSATVSDPLMAMALVETLAPLARSSHGIQFLISEQDVIGIIRSMLMAEAAANAKMHVATTANETAFISIAVFKWVSQLSDAVVSTTHESASSWLVDAANLIREVFELHVEKTSSFEHALAALTSVCCGSVGLLAFCTRPQAVAGSGGNGAADAPPAVVEPDAVLLQIAAAITHRADDVRAMGMHSLATVCAQRHTSPAAQVAQHCLFESVGDASVSTIEVLIRYLMTPFDDLRHAALRLLSVVVRFDWGVDAVQAAPGFLEWLLNRSTESTLTGSDWKFTIVQALVANERALTERIAPAFQDRLRRFEREGRFFTRAVAKVLIEDKFF